MLVFVHDFGSFSLSNNDLTVNLSNYGEYFHNNLYFFSLQPFSNYTEAPANHNIIYNLSYLNKSINT